MSLHRISVRSFAALLFVMLSLSLSAMAKSPRPAEATSPSLKARATALRTKGRQMNGRISDGDSYWEFIPFLKVFWLNKLPRDSGGRRKIVPCTVGFDE